MDRVFKALSKVKAITLESIDIKEVGHDLTHSCKFYIGVVGHSIQNCDYFHRKLQELMDLSEIEFYEEGEDEEFGKKIIPLLYETFRSAGCIHTKVSDEVNQVPLMFGELSIHMIKDEEPNEKIPVVYPVLSGDELSNWTAMELPIIFKSLEMSLNNEHEDNLDNNLNIDFEMIPNVDTLKNEEEAEDYGLPPDLSRMLEQEEKKILPHQELAEIINLRNGKEKKKVKSGTLLSSNERNLNRVSQKDSFPLPHIDTLVDNTAKHALFSFMDGATYQRAMVALFHDMMHKEIEVYVDDMIAKSHTKRDHTVNLKKLFKRLRKFQLKLNLAKCTFGVTSEKLLRFIVSEKEIEVDPDKIRAIQELSPPKSQKEVRGFLGRLNYIARFISQLTCKCDLIFKLLLKRDPGEWNEECQIVFYKIKEYLTNPLVLVPLTIEKPLILYLTVNKNSMGCVLGQHDETGNKEQAVYYLSKKFTKYESNYSAVEKMCYKDLMAVLHIEKDSPNELNPWKIYFDGASNALGHKIGVVLISPNGQYYPATARLNFNCTNNIAEYEALVMGLQAAIEMKADMIDVYGDSALVICQMRGEWETRDSKLVPYKKLVTELSKQFKEISLNHLPREENQIANALATISVMFRIKEAADVRPFDLEVREVSAHCLNVEEEVDDKPWYHDIMQYIKHQAYPENVTDNDKRTLRRLVMGFFLSGEVFYKRNRDQVLLRCVDVSKANKIMKEVHKGTCGAHANGYMFARKIMRASCYWLTLESNYVNFARKCHKCQIHADRIHALPAPLHLFTTPWPFSMWGMDVIGLITPKASNGHRFILVAIDYFTKWVEAAFYANVTQKVVCRFIQREIICRYGLPERIITDNASNLNGAMVKKVCAKFKIKHQNFTTYRPKMNGAVTSYSLVYRTEAVLPVEVEIPSLRVLMETELEDDEWVCSCYEQLNLIEEKRLAALCHGQMYQRMMMRPYEKKVCPRQFRE
ncbi:PREDICTED: uncharacterized protein LOC108661106 [Theobroma cacao]|uniref:Uncharacterized protein LOC108661106 n=1 Tax=Theobroma cacao TaxID=3641 RepID=A0AB32W0Q4_THECC|nr:PREDICTED: uncharacterized protein LOC108661106 [Theobroma cacao]